MRLELKNVKHFAELSRDGNAFSATLYASGKRICKVSNDGNGGCDMHEPLQKEKLSLMRKRLQPVLDYIATLPPHVSDAYKNDDGSPLTYDQDIDSVVSELFTDTMIMRDARRNLNRYVMGFDTKSKQLYTWSLTHRGETALASKVNAAALSDHMGKIGMKNPDVILLNQLPESEIIGYVKQAHAANFT